MGHETTASAAASAAVARIGMTRLMLNRLTDAEPGFPFRYKRPAKTA